MRVRAGGLAGAALFVSVLAGCSSARPAGAAGAAAKTGTPAARTAAPATATRSGPASPGEPTTTSVAPSTTAPTAPPTTIDPGLLPQTTQLPSPTDPAFLARISDLWQAILTGNTATAAPAFFPLSAYIQVKGISDPVHDYQTRLIPDYDQDIATLHSQIPPYAKFISVTVPNAAQWILPGVEYNKGSYWRVYGTRVDFSVNGQDHYFDIVSMISWRGQWYVVHLLSIR